MIGSLRAVQIDDSVERVSGSPNAARRLKRAVRSADVTCGTNVEAFNSPPKATGSAKSTPSSSRYKQAINSPNWRNKNGFVRGDRNQVDDPFGPSGSPSKVSGQGMCLLVAYKI